MKAASLIAGLVFVSLFALCMTPGASAATTTISAGNSFTKTVHADMLDRIDYSWSVSPSTATLDFVITQPGGTEYWSYSGSSYSFFVVAGLSGDYIFEWTNPGSSSVTLTYDVGGGSGGVGNMFDTALLLLVIVAIVIVVVVVVVIVLVLRGGKKSQPAQPTYPPPGEAPAPFVAKVCPKCGGPIDTQQVFCPKCGFRVR